MKPRYCKTELLREIISSEKRIHRFVPLQMGYKYPQRTVLFIQESSRRVGRFQVIETTQIRRAAALFESLK